MSTSLTSTNSQAFASGASLLGSMALLALLSGGCTQTPLCPELGDCGGPVPYGTWELSPGHPSCSEDLYVPATDTRLLGGEFPAARTPSIEPALYDWCYLLVAGGGESIQLKPPRFYYDSAPIGAATITYNMDGTYSAGLTRTGTFVLDFPAACVRAFGATDGRPAEGDATGTPVNVCKQLEVPVRASGQGEGSYPNATCEPNPEDPGGCLCAFDVTETGGPVGRFEMLPDGHTILHYTSNNFPIEATYCNQGSGLQLTGANGSYLFNVKGLRTMDLAPGAGAATP